MIKAPHGGEERRNQDPRNRLRGSKRLRDGGVAADLQEVTDIAEIMGYGVMHRPGPVIGEDLKCVGGWSLAKQGTAK